MTKDCPNYARITGNIINADGPLTRVNRPSTSTVPDECIGAHGTGNQVRHTTDESHTRFPQLTNGHHPSITASNADSHSPGLHASSTNNTLGNQQLNNSVIHSGVPNAAASRYNNVHNINAGGVTSTLPFLCSSFFCLGFSHHLVKILTTRMMKMSLLMSSSSFHYLKVKVASSQFL
jgi:hypothetical protein